MQSFSFIPLMTSEKKIFEYFFENLIFRWPWRSIKINNLDKIHMVCTGLLQKHFCKTFCSNTEINANFHFSHYKFMETLAAIATKAHGQRQ